MIRWAMSTCDGVEGSSARCEPRRAREEMTGQLGRIVRRQALALLLLALALAPVLVLVLAPGRAGCVETCARYERALHCHGRCDAAWQTNRATALHCHGRCDAAWQANRAGSRQPCGRLPVRRCGPLSSSCQPLDAPRCAHNRPRQPRAHDAGACTVTEDNRGRMGERGSNGSRNSACTGISFWKPDQWQLRR